MVSNSGTLANRTIDVQTLSLRSEQEEKRE
jgi:hypothetical protein